MKAITQKQFDKVMKNHIFMQESRYGDNAVYLRGERIRQRACIARFQNFKFDHTTQFFPRRIEKVIFDGGEVNNVKDFASLRDNVYGGMNFIECVFNDVYFYNVNFQSVTFERCTFNRGGLIGCNMGLSGVHQCQFNQVMLNQSNWFDAEMQSTFFRMDYSYIDYNLFVLGYDNRDYMYWMAKNPKGVVNIKAGCRSFTGLDEAHNHWDNRDYLRDHIKPRIMSFLDVAEKVCIELGWKLNPDPMPEQVPVMEDECPF